MPIVNRQFFDQTAECLAVALLGAVLRRRVQTSHGPVWLAARIIETEAYYRHERGSHSSLGYTKSAGPCLCHPAPSICTMPEVLTP